MVTLRPYRLDEPEDHKVIAALAAVGAGRSTVELPAPSPDFRAELRAQLVAVTPRLVSEGVHPETEVVPRRAATAATGTVTALPRARARTRPLTVLVAGAAVVVLGLGGATWLARNALPGDALYGLKRTAESVDLSFSGSELDRGHGLLVDAQTRVEEVNSLLGRPQSMALGSGPAAAGALSDSTQTLVVDTLQSADTDTRKGVTTIGDDAVTRKATDGLALVVGWAQGQRDRIDALVARLPDGSAARTQAGTSAAEIRAALDRASDLLADVEAGNSCTRERDELGPLPCGATRPAAATTPAPTTGGGPGSSAPAPVISAPATTAVPGTGQGGGTATAPTSTSSSSSPATPRASGGGSAVVPDAPAASVPAQIDECGVQVDLPVATVSVGTCTPSP